MNIALDTNILVYAEGSGHDAADIAKRAAVWSLVDRFTQEGANLFVPIQALVELQDVVTRKRGLSRTVASELARSWLSLAAAIPTDRAVFDRALQLSAEHQLRIFDAVILSAASEAKCQQLLSEDMQTGFSWGGVEIVNPFV